MKRRTFLERSTVAAAGLAPARTACGGNDAASADDPHHPHRSRAALRAVALPLHAVHGAARRDRQFRRGRLGSPARRLARRRGRGDARAGADDGAVGRDLRGLLSLARRRRPARAAAADDQPALGRHRVEPDRHRGVRRLLPAGRRPSRSSASTSNPTDAGNT